MSAVSEEGACMSPLSEMSFEEKGAWLAAVIGPVAALVYLIIIVGRAQDTPIAEVAWVWPMVWTIGSIVGAMILGYVVLAAVWPKEADKKDERDKEINRFGEHVGQTFFGLGAGAALILSMVQVDSFWIGNTLFFGCAISTLIGSVAKIVAYRRGFQSC